MKELIKDWHQADADARQCGQIDASDVWNLCATDLENYLASLWTTISDDPESLPEGGRKVLAFTDKGTDADVIEWRPTDLNKRHVCKYYAGWRWRYFGIPGIDYPEQTQ